MYSYTQDITATQNAQKPEKRVQIGQLLSTSTKNMVYLYCQRALISNIYVLSHWLGIRIMCQSWTICLSADCCCKGIALWKPNRACQSNTWEMMSSSSVINVPSSLYDISWTIAYLALNNNQSLTHFTIQNTYYIFN